MNDAQLIQSFAEHGSETAFRSLVERHLSLVFGTARRVTGDNALAEEVAQTVFVLLARKAVSFGPGTILSGWLYRTTRFVAARALLAERRRRRREEEAAAMQLQTDSDPLWQRVAPRLDDALGRLGDTDRNALLLRFFEQCSMRDVGASLGLSEEAARKRVARALEKLRRILRRRGTEVSSAALIAGLTHEGAEAGAAAGLATKVSAVVVAHLAAGTGIAVGSWVLLADALAAWRWAKIKAAFVGGAAIISVALLLPAVIRSIRDNVHGVAPAAKNNAAEIRTEPTADNRPAAREPDTIEIAGQTIPLRSLRVTVLDAQSAQPIPRAEVPDPRWWAMRGNPAGAVLSADSNGIVNIRIPERVPSGERMDQFSIEVRAKDYAPRTIQWLSTTGSVLSIVSPQYTVRLEPGITLSGTVRDDTGRPLPGVRVGAVGNSYRGYTVGRAEVRAEDFPSFFVSSEASGPGAIVTDQDGRFQFTHFPSDLRALVIDLLGTDGAHRKFCTPRGNRLTADELPEVSFEELKNGTARLVMPRGVTVEGMVANTSGDPVVGAVIVEGVQWGNLKVLSRTETDLFGRFRFTNCPPREIIFCASAEGYASGFTVESVEAGMQEVRIKLSPEQPLWGRVVDEAGQPLAAASITVPDYLNEGQGLDWKGKTDADGRFVWRGAPANEVALAVSAPGYALRIARVRPSAEEFLIPLRPGNSDVVRVTGQVTDAETDTPVESFRLKVSHGMWGAVPDPAKRTVEGSAGTFDLEISQNEIPVGIHPAWILLCEADGYEPTFTRPYHFEEGDQHLEFALQRGGAVEGVVQSPGGEAAANAQLAFAPEGDSVLSSLPGGLSTRDGTGRSDVSGQFKLAKPPKARALVVFHDAGWAIVPVQSGTRTLDVQLHPWGRIVGTVARGEPPAAGLRVGLNKLTWDWADALTVLYSTTTDQEGHFAFDKVPAGEFVLSVESRAWQKLDQPTVRALQTPVTVSPGESQTVLLGTNGRSVLARLRADFSGAMPAWTNALAILSRDVAVRPEPARSDYLSNASHMAARFRYTHDPTVLAALREARSHVGEVNADGTAIFHDIPAGRYVLEVKLFNESSAVPQQSGFRENPVNSRLRATVSVPDGTDTADNAAPLSLGEFILEPL